MSYPYPVTWPLGRVVEIWWHDSCTHSGGWASPEDYKKSITVGPLRSVGYVLQADETSISLTQSQSGFMSQISGVLAVPTSEIVRIHVLDIDPWPNQPTSEKRPKTSSKLGTPSITSRSTRRPSRVTERSKTISARTMRTSPKGTRLTAPGGIPVTRSGSTRRIQEVN
jgi:hypothetical protein